MVALHIVRRGGTLTECKDCGCPNLEWILTKQGWRYVPFGTDDLSGTVHPGIPCGGKVNPVGAGVPPHDDAAITALVERLAALEETAKCVTAQLETLGNRREVRVVIPDMPAVDAGRQHPMFEPVVKAVGAGVNVFIRGPAGSGKTTGAAMAAQALNLDFESIGVNLQTSKSELLGYMSASGVYIGSAIRRRYEQGGLLLIDECDRGHPGVLTAIHGLRNGSEMAFPDGMVRRHSSFRLVAAANTYGRGCDALYVGANQLDAATLDAFANIDWDYDWDFTAELAGNADWTSYVAACSSAASDLRLEVVIGPRAAINGARLLAAGFDRPEVEDMVLWRPISLDDKLKILEGVREADDAGLLAEGKFLANLRLLLAHGD